MRISNREKRFKLTTEHVEYSKYMDLFQEAHTVSMRERERERADETVRRCITSASCVFVREVLTHVSPAAAP